MFHFTAGSLTDRIRHVELRSEDGYVRVRVASTESKLTRQEVEEILEKVFRLTMVNEPREILMAEIDKVDEEEESELVGLFVMEFPFPGPSGGRVGFQVGGDTVA